MNYYRRYVGSYMKKTMRLSMTDHGAYGLLLDYYYSEEKPIPLDMEEVFVICRAIRPDDRKAVQKVLAGHFERRADGFHNERADEEIAAAVQARKNGSGGGRPPKTGNETGSRTGPKTGIETGGITEGETGNETGKETGKQTASITGEGGGSGQPLTYNLQPTTTTTDNLQPSTVSQSQNPSPAATPPVARKARRGNGEANPKTAEAWEWYASAYYRRYGVQPVRNATVNGQLAQFVKRLGAKEAPPVAQFYLSHNRGLYVNAKHPVSLMLRDCEGLRTEWATGHAVTESEARQTDQTATTGAVFDKLISEADR